MSDFRLAFRQLLRHRGFTVTAVLTLALGIGIALTAFSWVRAVLLDPLPGTLDSGRIVSVESLSAAGTMIDSSYPDCRDYGAQATQLAGLIVFKERPLNLGNGDGSERAWAEMVSGNFFSLLGVKPRLGRFFAEDDRADSTAAAHVAVISEGLWRRSFQGARDVIGRTVRLNRHEFTIIGVAPAEFPGTINGLVFDVWVPLALQGELTGSSNWLENRASRPLHLLARLTPGATVETARVEMGLIAQRLAREYPKTNAGLSATVVPLAQASFGVQTILASVVRILFGMGVLVLLIVCANLSNLMLVRATARQHEISVRQALGAGWGRIVRSLLAESLLLALAGAIAGMVFTFWAADLLRFFAPASSLPLALAGRVDWSLAPLAFGFVVLATFAAGLAPALWAARPELVSSLRSGRGAGISPHAERWRSALTSLEIALALVALSGAAFAWQAFRQARAISPGFEAGGVLLAAINPGASGYTAATGPEFIDRLSDRLRAQPGVEQVAFAETVPFGLEGGSWEDLTVPGFTPQAGESMKVYRNRVSPDYFRLMRIPLLEGRDFNAADDARMPLVAIVNETFVRRYLAGGEAIGRTFEGWGENLTIVGVAKDAKYARVDEAAQPYFYVPLQQFYHPGVGLAVHVRMNSGVDPAQFLPALRRELRAVDPEVPIFEAATLQDFIGAASFSRRLAAALLALIGATAVGLAALGLYGVIAFAVSQRTREIGVRIALGAQSFDVVRLLATRGLRLIAFGLAAGGALSLALLPLVQRFLGSIGGLDPLAVVLAAAAVSLIAMLACLAPLRGATRVNPVDALRAE